MQCKHLNYNNGSYHFLIKRNILVFGSGSLKVVQVIVTMELHNIDIRQITINLLKNGSVGKMQMREKRSQHLNMKQSGGSFNKT